MGNGNGSNGYGNAPLQRLSPLPTFLTPQSNGNGADNGDGSNGYGNKGGGSAMETMAMAMAKTCAMTKATRWQAIKRVMERSERAMMMAKKRAMVQRMRARASRAKAMATRVLVKGQ